MSLKLNSSGGGSVTLSEPVTANNYTLTLPASSGTLATTDGTNTTFTSITDSGNLTFTGTGNRITGDFSNATASNRVMFQNSITNASTNLGLVPNGTSTTTTINLEGSSDATNCPVFQITQSGGDAKLVANIRGTASYGNMIFQTGIAERMRIDTSGNVGIGTNSPTSVAGYTSLSLSNTTSGGLIDLMKSGTMYGRFYTDSTHVTIQTGAAIPLIFNTNNLERMRIDSSGNLLVGYTALPTNGGKLNVSGVTASAGYRDFNYTSFGTNGWSFYWTGAALQSWINGINVGNVSISSDYRVKQKVETQQLPAIERIMKLRPVTYELADYKSLFKADGVSREGFIAHELAEVIPSAVEGEKDAEDQIQSLKLDALCSVMAKAIQELSAQATALKAELDATKAEVAALKG